MYKLINIKEPYNDCEAAFSAERSFVHDGRNRDSDGKRRKLTNHTSQLI